MHTSVRLILDWARPHADMVANIARDNRAGLNLGAITYVAPRDSLLRQARGADATRLLSGNKNGLGVLHGIPILVKDNMDTHPSLGMPTSAGSLALGQSAVFRAVSLAETVHMYHR